jgi:MFS family permease
MVPKEEIPNAVVLYGLIVNLSRIFGPALAGLLVVTTGFGWCFTLDGLSYLVVIGSIMMMRANELYTRPITEKSKGAVMAGLRYIKSTTVLWITFAMLALIGIFSYNFTVTLPLFVTASLHGSTTAFTILFSVFSFGSVVGALFIARRREVRVSQVIFGAFALGFAMLLLSIAPNDKFALPAAFVLGFASILYITPTTTLVQIESKPEMVGRVLALQSVFMFGTTPIGGPLLGWLSDVSGGRTPLILGGAVALATAILGYYTNKRFTRSKYATNN